MDALDKSIIASMTLPPETKSCGVMHGMNAVIMGGSRKLNQKINAWINKKTLHATNQIYQRTSAHQSARDHTRALGGSWQYIVKGHTQELDELKKWSNRSCARYVLYCM